jgi:hypothetical protein
MKPRNSLISLLCLISLGLASQEITGTFVSKGNVYIKSVTKVTYLGSDTLATLSKNKQFIIYLRYIQKEEKYFSQIVQYNCATTIEKVLVQASENNQTESSAIQYANSDNYPFPSLGEIKTIQLSPLQDRIYFETTAWAVASAVHYYDITTRKIYFFHSGSLNKVYPSGAVSIQMTDIENQKDGTTCRFWQNWLYDTNGKKIKALGNKCY